MDIEFNLKEIKVGIEETLEKSHPMYFAKDEDGKIDHYRTYTNISKVMIQESYSPVDKLKVYSAYRSLYNTPSPGHSKIFGLNADMVKILDSEIVKMKEWIETDRMDVSMNLANKVNKGVKRIDNKPDNEGEVNNYPRYFALKLILEELKIIDRERSDEYDKVNRANIQRLHEFITGIPGNSLNSFIYHGGEREPKAQRLKLYLTKIRELFVPFQKNVNVHVDKIVDKIDQLIRDIGTY